MQTKRIKYSVIIVLLLVVLLVTAAMSMTIGEVRFRISELSDILSDRSSMEYGILAHIRIPRTLLAFAVGGSLSLTGVILQGIYRNPLVEPYTLGISGGASFGVTLAIITGMYTAGRFILPVFGFVGAFITIFLVYVLSLKRGAVSVSRMLLIGVMISFISSSLVMFLMSIASVDHIPSIVFWTMGSLNESNASMVNGMVILSVSLLLISYFFAVPLNALRMGEFKARHLGINTSTTVRLLFVLTSLLTGSCIAVSGVIGFVGLIIPHIVRLFVGTDYKILLVSSFLSGGIFLILCDIIARTIIAPNELPIGVITGILGGITFIFIVSGTKVKSKLS